MKKIAVLLLCFSVMLMCGMTVYADTPSEGSSSGVKIGTEVPRSHIVTMRVTGEADATLDGSSGTRFEVERLSEPHVVITVHEGYEFVSADIKLDGEDITYLLTGLELRLPPVYKDEFLDIDVKTRQKENDPAPPTPTPEPEPQPEPKPSPEPRPGAIPTPGPNPDNTPSPTEVTPSPSPSDTVPAQPDSAPEPSPASDNPATGIAGGISAGTLGVLLLGLIRKKHSSSE